MFRKLVSNLPFTPSLINQVGFYYQRLVRENITRRLVVIFSILTVVVQGIAIIAPPEASIAASSNDLIYGGLGNNPQNALLAYYDANGDFAGHRNLQSIYNLWGITRSDLANLHYETITGGPTIYGQWFSVGRNPHSGDIASYSTAGGSVYMRPLGVWGIGAHHRALVGKRAVDGWTFAVMIDCGNLAFFNPPPPLPHYQPPPPPTPKPNPVPSKQVRNLSRPKDSKQFVNANNTTVKPGDELEYTISVFNAGDGTAQGTVFEDNLNDVLEYADLTDKGGGTLNGGVLKWPTVDIPAQQTVKHTFRVKVKSPVPSTPTSKSDPQSFDLCMDNIFKEKPTRVCVNIPPPAKLVEKTTRQLPDTGPGLSMTIMASLTVLASFFFLRNRQLIKELVILKRQQGGGV